MHASSTLAAGLALLAGGAQAPDPAAPARAFALGLATHPYFSRVALERVESHPPFVFLVQRSAVEEAGRSAQLAERYAELLAPTLQFFERELAAPLGLARRADKALVVAVLPTPGDLDNYERVMNATRHLGAQGFHDRVLNAAVVCEDPFQRLRSVREVAQTSRHLFAHVCQTAWYSGEGDAPLESWFMEGLACELSRRDPEEELAPDADELRAFLRDLADEKRRWTHARTCEELSTVLAPDALAEFFQERATPAQPPPDDLAAARAAFQHQGALLTYYLLEGEQRVRRQAYLAFLGSAFAGRGDRESFAQSFQPTSALDEAFVAWALRMSQARTRADTLDSAAIQKALRRGASSEPAAAAPSAAPSPSPAQPATAASSAPAPAPAVTVPGLVLDLAGTSADERFALALYELSRGRARAGLTTLEARAREAASAGARERAEREQRRALAWVALRDEFLKRRLESGEVIEFTYKGNKLKTKVLGFADGQLKLEKSRAPESLSAEAIDPLELAQQIESGGASEWARIYPYVLRDDPRAKKLLKDDGGEGGALLADLRADYPARLRLGRVEGRLAELATRKAPANLKEVRAQLDDLATWRAEAEGLSVLEQKREALRAHARSLLARELELVPREELPHGKLQVKGDALHLTFEFDDPRELEDFTAEPYPRGARRALGAESSADVPFQVQGGALVAQGQASLRCLIDVAAPLSVRYVLEYEKGNAPAPRYSCALGICDDGREHFVWAIDTGHLQRYDTSSSDVAHGDDVLVLTDTRYALELRHDGKEATLLLEGKAQRSLAVGSRQSGAIFLCTASDGQVRVERIEIEGRLAPDSFERLKRARIERGLARF